MILLYCFSAVIAVLSLFILTPVQFQVCDQPVLSISIRWLFLRYQICRVEDAVISSLTLFGREFSLPRGKKKAPSSSLSGKTAKTKKSSSKITAGVIWQVVKNPAFSPILKTFLVFFRRTLGGFKLVLLECHIGLKDYYLQGFLSGLSYALPVHQRLAVHCNFHGHNTFQLKLNFRIWKFLLAVALLLLCFPYLKMYKLIKLVNS